MLSVDSINTFYGRSQAIHSVSFSVEDSQVVALLGRNGAGKSTTLRSIMAVNPISSGCISYNGRDISSLSTNDIADQGITLVPETRDPFYLLTVRENIMLGHREGSPYPLDRLMALFPLLEPLLGKKGGELSGGQQQMMVIARALAMGPKLLLLDEPSQGLAPIMVKAVSQVLKELKHDKLSIVLVEQNLQMALNLADHIVVLEDGCVADEFSGDAGRADPGRLEQYLTVH